MPSLATMARRNVARPGETLKDALITVDASTWEAFKELMRNRDTSASAELRQYMARQVRAAGRRTNA